ncbi:hypothetical protein AwWohl_12680 [Gammaproteobacteria bacterium]|nr:hypothetical protein AwWohl_12680 [Gammaproteobacteria bacterium]
MTKVFISGSIKIKSIDENIMNRLDKLVESDFSILIGDANGVDTSIQHYFKDHHSKQVTVYCTGDNPRNNLNHWPIKIIRTKAAVGTRAFFTAKDIAMADDCDYGFMIWDCQSAGTLNNVLELIKRGKISLVYLNKNKTYRKVMSVNDVNELIQCMSKVALDKADQKLKILETLEILKSNKPQTIKFEQISLF